MISQQLVYIGADEPTYSDFPYMSCRLTERQHVDYTPAEL